MFEEALHPQGPAGEEGGEERAEPGEREAIAVVLHLVVDVSGCVSSARLQQVVGEEDDPVEEVSSGPDLPCRRWPRGPALLEQWRPSHWVGQAQQS